MVGKPHVALLVLFACLVFVSFVGCKDSATKGRNNGNTPSDAGILDGGDEGPEEWEEDWSYIPPGQFTMGSPDDEPGRGDDEYQHPVSISNPFLMKKTEVTQAEWQLITGNNPSIFHQCGDDCPVDKVSWYEAIAYSNALSYEHGLEPCYQDATSAEYSFSHAATRTTPTWPKGIECLGYRLPTESEWEYAARAGSTTGLINGDLDITTGCTQLDPLLDLVGWYCANSNTGDGSRTQEVGQKEPNMWDLYDMHGNVWEWVWDWYGPYPSEMVVDPKGLEVGTERVMRGGSWGIYARYCRSATRHSTAPGYRDIRLGFRLARTMPTSVVSAEQPDS